MATELLEELKRENLCTWFILPLIKLSKFNFLTGNFVNSYLSTGLQYVLVEVMELQFLSRSYLQGHPHFADLFYTETGNSLIAYGLSGSSLQRDVKLFTEGKYSKLSRIAKQDIRAYSGLPYQKKTRSPRVTETDGRLLALEKHEVLREWWERLLSNDSTGSYVELRDMELLSVPDEKSYIDLSTLKQRQL